MSRIGLIAAPRKSKRSQPFSGKDKTVSNAGALQHFIESASHYVEMCLPFELCGVP